MAMVQDFLQRNKEAGIRAVKLQAGKIALTVLKQIVKSKMPIYMRGYLATPFTSFILANMVHVGVAHNLHQGNKTVEQLGDAMLQASMMELLEAIDVQALIASFLKAMPQEELVALEQANQPTE